MAFKQFALDDQTIITVYKRRVSRNLRLSLSPNGQIRVSIPVWAPYAAGLQFAKSRHQWIAAQRPATHKLYDGQVIGKAHHLEFVPDASLTKVQTRLQAGAIIVRCPAEWSAADDRVQAAAQAACVRALRQQAEKLLPPRLAQLALRNGFRYHSVSIKRLKSRWGSCDHQQNIVLNLFLMQLPWECIDYVLLHELTHTEVLRHGPEFWTAMQRVLPATPHLRKTMRQWQPILGTGPSE